MKPEMFRILYTKEGITSLLQQLFYKKVKGKAIPVIGRGGP
jgi:hypothetical protein